jgi:hypothetical protein
MCCGIQAVSWAYATSVNFASHVNASNKLAFYF